MTAERVRIKYRMGHPVREWFLPSGRRNEPYIRAVDREPRNAEIQAALDAGKPPAAVAKRVLASASIP